MSGYARSKEFLLSNKEFYKVAKDKVASYCNYYYRMQPVTMDLWYRGTAENPNNKITSAGFQLTGSLKRSDFGIGPKLCAPFIGDIVSIKADGEFIKI